MAAAFDALNADANVSAITLTGTPALNLDVAQTLNDTHALNAITNTSYGIVVTDTGANVSAAFDALNANTKVSAITLTGTPTLNLDVAQTLNDTHALNAITNTNYGIVVTDTGANVSAAFDTLNADAKVSAITLTGTPTLNLDVAQTLNDTHALNVITNTNYGIVVTDTGANVSAAFDALNANTKVSAITLTGTPTLNLDVAQTLNDTHALNAITNTNYGIVVTDTGANVAANLAALNADSHITSILPADGSQNLVLAMAQMMNDTRAIALLDPFTITVTDTASGFDALSGAQIATFKTDGVALLDATDADVALTKAQREALGADGISVIQPYSGGTSEVVTYAATGKLSTIVYQGVAGQPYTSFTVNYGSGGKPASATYNDDMAKTWNYKADGFYDVVLNDIANSDSPRSKECVRALAY